MFEIALYRPQMPANAGNVIRLAANFGIRLHFIGPLDFYLDDKRLKRAGLDYHEIANLTYHISYEDFLEKVNPARIIAATVQGTVTPDRFSYQKGDVLLFGRETSGLPPQILEQIPKNLKIRIPMVRQSRCLNLANSAAIIAFEAWKHFDFYGAA